ncbi:MAG: hypothetical protein KY476_15195 [Planctomycetes bacterium]|nr:hypothetical protein [Planctomycetota bacterium]
MAAIIRQLPWFDHATSVSVRGEPVAIKPEQIVLWISVGAWGRTEPNGSASFPAILDTGCNHNLLMQERHLVEWAGLPISTLHALGPVRVSGRRAILLVHVRKPPPTRP